MHNPDGGSENLFCLDGWIMMGPAEKAWQPVLTAHLVEVPITTFCVFECVVLSDLGFPFTVPRREVKLTMAQTVAPAVRWSWLRVRALMLAAR